MVVDACGSATINKCWRVEDWKKDECQYVTARCLYDLACDVRKEAEWFKYLPAADNPLRRPWLAMLAWGWPTTCLRNGWPWLSSSYGKPFGNRCDNEPAPPL